MHDIIRSYKREVVSRLESLPFEKEIIGTADYDISYPIYKIEAGKGRDVLISGGVHGNEPAGVYAMLDFLEHHMEDYMDDFRFHAYPCVNPTGFEFHTRKNFDEQNINAAFKLPATTQESAIVIESLQRLNISYLFTMDLHECLPDEKDAPEQFFLWEMCDDKKRRVGKKILKNVRKLGIPICNWKRIIGDINDKGVISYPEGFCSQEYADGTSFDAFLRKNYTDHAFTTETHTSWKLEKRIEAQITSLRTVLDSYL